MPRPTKRRKICHYPQNLGFMPFQADIEKAPTVLTVDEYETVRLIDSEGLSQEQCCELMQVARTTVQRIYDSARKKIATALVGGTPLIIEGGEFTLCDGCDSSCGNTSCFKRLYYEKYQKPEGGSNMRIAVTHENGMIFQHFGHTKEFKVYDIADGKVIRSEVVDTNGSGHGALAGVLTAIKADVLICGGIGAGAQTALAAASIKLYGGASGDADDAVNDFIKGRLRFDPNVQCSHHSAGHICGDHGCGKEHNCH